MSSVNHKNSKSERVQVKHQEKWGGEPGGGETGFESVNRIFLFLGSL